MRGWRVPLFFLLVLWSLSPATAGVVVTFYSRDMGESFPHAFFGVTGVPDAGGAAVDTNYGFTAKHTTPAILFGPVLGEIVSVTPAYLAKSDAHMRLEINDAEYERLMELVKRWRDLPGKSYSLNRRNCVFFVADAARAIGLDAADDPKLMKKPRSFLESVVRRNTALLLARKNGPLTREASSRPVLPITGATVRSDFAPETSAGSTDGVAEMRR